IYLYEYAYQKYLRYFTTRLLFRSLIEEGEKEEDAARREIFEEVGLRFLTLIHTLQPIHYIYQRDGKIEKTVHYFLFHFVGKEKRSEEHTSELQSHLNLVCRLLLEK